MIQVATLTHPRNTVKISALALITAVATTHAAGPTNQVNGADFSVLCTVVNAAENVKESSGLDDTLTQIGTTATTVKVILNNYERLIKEASKPTNPQGNQESPPTTPQTCHEGQPQDCAKAVEELRKMEKETKEALELAATNTGSMREQINKTIDKIIQLVGKAGDQAPNGQSVKQLLRAVVYGEGTTGNTPKMDSTAADRETSCGKRSSNGAKSAKLTLGATLVCLCASDGSQTNNKGCYDTGEQQNFVNQGAVDSSVWTQIKMKCKTAAGNPEAPQADIIGAAATKIRPRLATAVSSSIPHGYLGTIAGTDTTGGCTGNAATDNGACAYFANNGGTSQENPEWLTTLDAAADALRNEEKAAQSRLHTITEIKALNDSLTNLLEMVALTEIRTAFLTDDQITANEVVDAEQRCKAAGGDQKKCKALEDKDCTFNKESNKCELKKELKEKLEKVNQETGGKDGKKEECKGKQQKDCTGNYKWEGKECKDSGFLVNKKIALNMVAAFVALLF
uniref:Variant surface glycoprotein 435 n=1 Tax=Trypanosoma brucei TaxID=5691 RepID=M4SY36_9TRYP|nr:variant surface glycoprotein 435 [Trypanosoma brucei]